MLAVNRSADGASHTFCGVTPRPQIENVQHCAANKYLPTYFDTPAP
jgi:hypothetical protein